jgi:hypothetical protein
MLGRLGQDHRSCALCFLKRPAPGGGQREQVQAIAANVADAAGGPECVDLRPLAVTASALARSAG